MRRAYNSNSKQTTHTRLVHVHGVGLIGFGQDFYELCLTDFLRGGDAALLEFCFQHSDCACVSINLGFIIGVAAAAAAAAVPSPLLLLLL